VPNVDSPVAPIAYYWGEDAFEIERAVRSFRDQLSTAAGDRLDVWQSPAEEGGSGEGDEESGGGSAARRRARIMDEATLRLATAPLFGAGTLVVIRQPGTMTREKVAEQRLIDLVRLVPPGNGLCFTDLSAAGSKLTADRPLPLAVREAGGSVREFPALTRERMEGWITARGTEFGVRLEPGAARLLAERVGAFVREGDVDRRRQSALAWAELEKLSLYRPDGAVTRQDVEELVAEVIPGSTWAFLDAVAGRHAADAAALAERLQRDGVVLPVIVAQLHRRIRELISVREHLDSGARAGDLVRVMKLQPFRAQKLVDQARIWTLTELESALEGLLDLDLQSKGISRDSSTVQMSDARDGLALQVWISAYVPGSGQTHLRASA
jgi:DNA polymerase III delta subunit